MTKSLVLAMVVALSQLLAAACTAADLFEITDAASESRVVATDYLAEDVASQQIADDCCCDGCRSPYWFAGTEFTFLGIDARTGGRITMSVNDADTAGTDLQIRDGDGIDDFAFAPRLWFGRQFSDKWSVVGRFWKLNDSAKGQPDRVPGSVTLPNFLTMYEIDRVEMMIVDVEAIRSFTPGAWKIDGSLGARHGSLQVDSTLNSFGVFTSGNFMQLLLANGSRFDGTGVTGSLFGRRQIGGSNAHLFIGGRASALWGFSDSFGQVSGTLAVSPNTPLLGAATVTRNGAIARTRIAEFQVGVQWDFALESLPMNAFFSTAFEYQHWDIEGPPTGGAGFGGTLADITVNSFSSAGLGDAQLYGLSIATGFTW